MEGVVVVTLTTHPLNCWWRMEQSGPSLRTVYLQECGDYEAFPLTIKFLQQVKQIFWTKYYSYIKPIIHIIFRWIWWRFQWLLGQNSSLWSRHEDIQQHCKIGTKKTWSFSECGWHEWFYLCLILNIFMIFSKQFFYLNWFWYKNIDFFYVSFSSPSSSSSSLFPTKTSIPRSETQKWA